MGLRDELAVLRGLLRHLQKIPFWNGLVGAHVSAWRICNVDFDFGRRAAICIYAGCRYDSGDPSYDQLVVSSDSDVLEADEWICMGCIQGARVVRKQKSDMGV